MTLGFLRHITEGRRSLELTICRQQMQLGCVDSGLGVWKLSVKALGLRLSGA